MRAMVLYVNEEHRRGQRCCLWSVEESSLGLKVALEPDRLALLRHF